MPYNPYNGNYYGDGSDVKTDSSGNRVANEKTGATYTGSSGFNRSDADQIRADSGYGTSTEPSATYYPDGSATYYGSGSSSSGSSSSSSSGSSSYSGGSSSSSSSSSSSNQGVGNWGTQKVDTSNLSGYAKQWAEAYNGQMDAGFRPSDNINHNYAQSTTDYDSIFKGLQDEFGAENVEFVDYYDAAMKDFQQQMGQQQLPPQMFPQFLQMQQQQAEYEKWKNFDTSKFKTEAATIEDIASKYGFDYSRDYAKRQAELERQQKETGLNQANRKVDQNVEQSADALDRNYFQQYMQQQQGLTNNGVNAGIAADQNLRMAMNRQANMGEIYNNANNARYELNNALAQLGSEQAMREDSLYNERRQQGFMNALALSEFNQADNLARLQGELQARGQDMDMSQFSQNYDLAKQKLQEQIRQFDESQGFQQEQFDWSKLMDNIDNGFKWTDRSGYMPDGTPTMSREDMEFRNDLALQQFNRPYEELTMWEREQVDLNNRKLAQDQAQFNQTNSREWYRINKSGSGSGSSSNGSYPKVATNRETYNDAYAMFMREFEDQRNNGNFPGVVALEEELLGNPDKIESLRRAGYDINSVVDAMYAAGSKGQFQSKNDYTKYLDSLQSNSSPW